MANAINLIDGLDGLAAGIVAIAAGAFFLYATGSTSGDPARRTTSDRSLRRSRCGLCVGFLPHNFHPAQDLHGRLAARCSSAC